ncbi:MAG: ATP-dependent Clp protease ATP-binding subunit [Clostridia bacterium]|nr:ATP-dependent Clp protease ATP-binding subunit [Clostridia bacterium]
MTCVRCKKNPAVVFVSSPDGDPSKTLGYCIKCACDLNLGPVKQMMDAMGVEPDDLDTVSEQFNSILGFGEDENFEEGGVPMMPNLKELFNSIGNKGDKEKTDEKTDSKDSRKTRTKRKSIQNYCTDLTQKARDGQIDTIIGRDREINRTIQILCRRTKNNPVLIGEPGVGKTAIAEGLALRIAAGSVPSKLKNKEIQLLDLMSLVAGTQFRGQFESRIKSLIEEIKEAGNIILFIDEVHNLVGTGEAEGAMNAANILKPALSRGEIQVIGATTFNEYRQYIEKDAALERRFQSVKVEESSIQETYEVLEGIKKYYETYHCVKIDSSLIYDLVELSEKYISDRFLPDKAIDLLDESCTVANLRNPEISRLDNIKEKKRNNLITIDELSKKEEKEEADYEKIAKLKSENISLEEEIKTLTEATKDIKVTKEDVAHVIENWTGIPMARIIESELSKLANLEDELKLKIKGQDEAIKALAAAVKRSRVQISNRKTPASFIFVGPTGVGKTELVKQLSYLLFDTPETLIRLDMSEFMEKHSVSRIIGSPPGYVGYDEAGQLTEKVRRKPYSIVLFDEIEKAHPDVMNILLQILDEGRITDAQGRTVDFSNTVIIMTSNAGSTSKEGALGFGRTVEDIDKQKALKGLSDFLRPEFLGRIDEIILFRRLEEKDYRDIAILMLDELKSALKFKGIKFEYSEDVPDLVVKSMNGDVKGARDLKNVIRREIENEIANIMISRRQDQLEAVDVIVKDDKFVIKAK